jgi:hypothetical protein
MSTPTSAIASTATGLILSPGLEPAENTSMRSPARWRNQPAAIWDRPASPRHSTAELGPVWLIDDLRATSCPRSTLGRLRAVRGTALPIDDHIRTLTGPTR